MLKRMLFGFVMSAFFAACGSDVPVASLGAQVRIDAALATQIDRVSIYVLGPKMSDGKFLPCDLLRLRTVDPTSADVTLLASRTDVTFVSTSGSATLSEVPSGKGRVVYVEAYGGTNVVANGCAEQVTVKAGATSSVAVDVYPL